MTHSGITLRKAENNDAKMLYKWANDPETRLASFSSDPIPWETHMQWFSKVLSSDTHQIYIAQDEHGVPVGQIRFKTKGAQATLSVVVAPESRGKGYGKNIVEAGAMHLFTYLEIHTIHAYVKPENAASAHLFTKTGFRQEEETEIKGNPALHFILEEDML